MKKMLAHAMRYVLFGDQIMKKGTIEDFGAANSFYYQIMEDKLDGKEWKEIESVYKPMHDKLLDQVFSRSISFANFLKSDIPLPVAELQRVLQFPGSFDGQSKIAILDIIRTELMKEEDFAKQ